MTREDHISYLETIGCDGWTVTTEAYESLQFAIEALKQEPKWIPVSERLPEKDDLYLICFDDGDYELSYFLNGEFCCNSAFSYSGVIAWMPLPTPYRAESEVKHD